MRTHLYSLGRVVAGLCFALLAGCGGGGYGGGGGGSSPPAATLSISVNPTTITVGQSATITWTSNGATCVASGSWSGAKAGSGTETVTPPSVGMFTYSLMCSGGGYGESQTISTVLTVNAMSGFNQTDLVSRFAGTAAKATDTNLTNPHGVAFAPGAPAWVMTNRAAAMFDGNGQTQSAAGMAGSSVSVSANGLTLDPSAIVANHTSDFRVMANGRTGAATLVYAGRNGMIGGWSAAVDRANGVVMFRAADGAVYTGLTLAETPGGNRMLAVDFRNNKIDVFDVSFTRLVSASGAFVDASLPAGYAPAGILAIRNGPAGTTQVYVSYAQQLAPDNQDNAVGAGLGVVNVFDANGKLLRHLVPAGGILNAPSSMALAPKNFGTFSSALLVGNLGDGKINAFDVSTGRFIGTLSDSAGRPLINRGLSSIAFGNDSHDQPRNALFFTAGTDEADGVFGRIDLATAAD